MNKFRILFAALAVAGLCTGVASAGDESSHDGMSHSTPAAKVDNGLGELPPLSEWREPWLYSTPAEKIDNGLGELPPVSEWREPWLYAMPAEKIDSGLGDIVNQLAATHAARN